MNSILIWGILSIPVTLLSLRALRHTGSHGFYRFFAWECMALLLAINLHYWFSDPYSVRQIASWLLLSGAIYPVVAAFLLFRKYGKADAIRKEQHLYHFEKTTRLIDSGIYGYIRHPMYCSLIMLTWGIFLKHISIEGILAALSASLFMVLTAMADERECISYFGDQYRSYMKRTKRFIPFVF